MTESTTTGLFYSGRVPEAVEERSVDSSILEAELNEERVDFARTAEWIRDGRFTRVALQFPDSMLGDAVPIAQKLEKDVEGLKTFILADTTYRSCCIDEVAAAHAGCDALVHYGEACFSSPNQNIPVRYVLEKLPVSEDTMISRLEEIQCIPETFNIAVLTDSSFAHSADNLTAAAARVLKRPCTSLPITYFTEKETSGETTDSESLRLGRRIDSVFENAEEVVLFFIGAKDSPLLPLFLLTFPQIMEVIHFDPAANAVTKQSSNSMRGLRKRLFLIEKVRDANSIGLVIGSVGVAGHVEAVARMRQLVRARGKRIFVISVGKVNVPKLANFSSDVDCFVLLSCPFGVILDTSDFDKPVVSLFEAEIALNKNKEWFAEKGWTSEYNNFIHDEVGDQEEDDDVPDVSLVSGRVRVERRTKEEEETKKEGGTVALYSAGDYFAARSWKGLDDSVTGEEKEEETSTRMQEGRSGRAAAYQNEP